MTLLLLHVGSLKVWYHIFNNMSLLIFRFDCGYINSNNPLTMTFCIQLLVLWHGISTHMGLFKENPMLLFSNLFHGYLE